MGPINGVTSHDDDDLPENSNALVPVNLLLKFSVGTPKSYVLKSSTINAFHTKFAVALSNHLVKIYDSHGSVWDEYEHAKSVTHVKFSFAEPDVFFTSSLDGKIRVWDTRCQGCAQMFCDDSDGDVKPILCFDYNNNEQIMCAGTEMVREDAFHLFWDRRSTKLLGGYWNSHAGDITQIHFHPQNKSWMTSSSVDGLINIFDLDKESEDEALLQTINVEAPINTCSWKSNEFLPCTTSIEEFHIFNLENAQSVFTTSRQKLYKDFQVKVDCMIDSLPIQSNFILATGKNTGTVHLWNIYNNNLKPGEYNPVGYYLKGHTDVVRTCCYNDGDGIILTGGDDGCVCLWKLKLPDLPVDNENLGRFLNRVNSVASQNAFHRRLAFAS